MKKTLIALAVGSAFAASAAYADVTISGSINAGPALVNQKGGSNGASNDIVGATAPGQNFTVGGALGNQVTTNGNGGTGSNWGINTNYSNITIASLEDLGGGLKLDFAYQLQANFQNTTNGATNRNSHIGLVGDSWGGVWYGTNEQLYEAYLYTADPLDGAAGMGGNLQMMGTPGFGNVFQTGGAGGNPSQCVNANGGIGCTDFYYRESQSIWYNSPNFNGFTFGVYTTLPAYKVNANPATGAPGINPVASGIGAKYVGTSLPIQAWLAYEHHRDMFGLAAVNPLGGAVANGAAGASTSSTDKAFQLGGGYTFGDVFVFLILERLNYKSNGTFGAIAGQAEYKRNAFDIGAKWNLATGYLGAQFIKANSGDCSLPSVGCSATDTGGWMIGAGYYHTMSKQTQAYVMLDYQKNQQLQYYTTAGGVGAPLSYGSNIYGLTVGLKHSF
jgi:predicted porin